MKRKAKQVAAVLDVALVGAVTQADFQVFGPGGGASIFTGVAGLLANVLPPPVLPVPPNNPGGFVFDDPLNAGRCVYGVFPLGFNLATPPSAVPYTVVFTVTGEGGVSEKSAPLPFLRSAAPAVPTGFRLIR